MKITLNGNTGQVEENKEVQVGDYLVKVTKVETKLSKVDEKKLEKLQKETSLLANGLEIDLLISGNIRCSMRLSWEECDYPNLSDVDFYLKDKTTQEGKNISSIIEKMSWCADDFDYTDFKNFKPVKEFHQRITKVLRESWKLDKKYGKSEGDFFDSYIIPNSDF